MPPPPPPPPPPGPGPPPPPGNAPIGKPGAMPDRKGLLGDIAKGRQLKKAVTNDRSAPTVGGGVISSGNGARVGLGKPPAIPSAAKETAASNGPPLAGLFAGGMPTLKKTSNESKSSSNSTGRVVSSPLTTAQPPTPSPPAHRPSASLSASPAHPPPPPNAPAPPLPPSAVSLMKTATANSIANKIAPPTLPPPVSRKSPNIPSPLQSRSSSSSNLVAKAPPPRPSSNPPAAPTVPAIPPPPPPGPPQAPPARSVPLASTLPPPAIEVSAPVAPLPRHNAPPPPPTTVPSRTGSRGSSADLSGLQAALATRSRSNSAPRAPPSYVNGAAEQPVRASYSLRPESVHRIDDSKYKFQPDSALPAPRPFQGVPKLFKSGRPEGATVPLVLDGLR